MILMVVYYEASWNNEGLTRLFDSINRARFLKAYKNYSFLLTLFCVMQQERNSCVNFHLQFDCYLNNCVLNSEGMQNCRLWSRLTSSALFFFNTEPILLEEMYSCFKNSYTTIPLHD